MSSGRFNEISSLNESQLQPLAHYGPVTALKIYKNFILAGYGSTLKLFKVDPKTDHTTLIFSQQVFKRNKIHCISVSKSGKQVGVSGGRSFIILNFGDLIEHSDSVLKEEKAINEWIVCCEFLSESQFLILNSHNTIYTVDISQGSKFELSEKVHCNEKSILYSGSIRLLDNGNKVLIAAGTVMSGVIVWDFKTKKIIHNLTEHEGSIFGVQISESGKYLISCSDDRSIKLYDFATGKFLANGWGHGSRIWNLAFFKNQTNGLRIMSTGEDCTIRFWRYEEGNDLLVQEELLESAHLGKHVWSGDIDDESLKLAVSGGADGKIRLHDLIDRGCVEEYSLDSISESSKIKFHKKEIIKQYVELPSLALLVILTSNGSLIQFDQRLKKFTDLELSPEESQKLTDFSIMKGFLNINRVMIISRNGDILQLQFTENKSQKPQREWIEETLLGSNKVTNLLADFDEASQTYYTLTDCPNPKIPFILRIYKVNNGSFQVTQTIRLEQPQQTSFTTTDMKIDPTNNWLILGSRYVSVAIYDLDEINAGSLALNSIFKKLSQGDTITTTSVIKSQLNLITLLLTVRDGVYMYVEVSKSKNGDFAYNIIHENKLSRGFVEGGFVKNNELILYGFKSSCFYIWNETKQIEIANELCGGAHRQWELFRYENQNNFKFVYINKSTLYIKEFSGRLTETYYGVINPGTHGREIRSLTISPEQESLTQTRIILTASEDASVKIGRLHKSGEIQNFWNLNNHVSGLQRIKFMNNEYVGSSAANEEFYIWKVTLESDVPVIKEFARLSTNSKNPDLRVMDFDSFAFEDGFIISTIYSDSSIKLWYFDTKEERFTLLARDHYTTCCILNVEFLFLDGNTLLQIGATDGHLTIWDITSFVSTQNREVQTLGKMVIRQQLHQNGIKATLSLANSDSYTIVTGGDDNSLILSQVKYDQGTLKLEVLKFIERAASSTITSISEGKNGHIFVTSVDQIVRLWNIVGNSLECVSATYTTIADTGCSDSAEIDGSHLLVIGGAGLSTWKQN